MGKQIVTGKIKAFCQINIVYPQLQFKAALGEFKFSQQYKVSLPVSANCKENDKDWNGAGT